MPGPLLGLIPATHTPFDADGRLDLAAVPRQAELFRESGIAAVFVAGTTGEWASMTVHERMALCDRWTGVAGDSLSVAVHVGHHCQSEAVALAKHAKESGASAIAAVAPSYYRPATAADLVDFLAPIAEAAGPLPFYYYEIPMMTGSKLLTSEVLREAQARIPTLRGMKYSHGDLIDLQECVQSDGGSLDVLFGMDDYLTAGLSMGVRGAIGATYNFAARHFQGLIRSFEAGDLKAAREKQYAAVRLVKVLGRYGFFPASKAVMGMIGADCGPVRPPLRPLGRDETAALARELKTLEILDRPLRVLD